MKDLYQPDYNNPRARERALHIIKWLEKNIGCDPSRHLHSKILRSPEAFGDSDLGRFLRNYLLVKINPGYKPGEYSQQYRIDPDRLNTLRAKLGLPPSKLQFNKIEERFRVQIAAIESGDFVYTETGGRAYNGLQNISKALKQQEFALRGYVYDYDIECCAPTLFLQRARQIKPNMKSVDYISFYLTNKNEVRDELCIKYNLSTRQVKQIINGLFQGGILNAYKGNKIFGYVNNNKYKIQQLNQDLFIKALQKDIRYIWKILREDIKLILKMNFARCNGVHKSNYYKILEGEVMRPVWKYLKKRKVRYFREHDGFRSDQFVIPNDLEQVVRSHTGYQVKFVWSKIEVNDTKVKEA